MITALRMDVEEIFTALDGRGFVTVGMIISQGEGFICGLVKRIVNDQQDNHR